MASTASEVIDFATTPAGWVFAGGASVASGKLRFAATIPIGDYGPAATATNNTGLDLTNSTYSFQVVTMPTTATVEHWLAFRLQIDTNNLLEFFIYTSGTSVEVECAYKAGGVRTRLAHPTYSPTTHARLRFRHASGTLFWEASADNTTWVLLASIATPIAITSLLRSIEQSGERTPGVMELDNFNQAAAAPTTPTAPVGLSSIQGGSQVRLSWTATAGATSYSVERSATSSSTGFAAVASSITSTRFDDTGLSPSTNYWYRVKATNSAGTSAASTALAVTTAAAGVPLPIPPGLPDHVVGEYWETYASDLIRLTEIDAGVNVIFLFQAVPTGGDGSTNGHVSVDLSGNATAIGNIKDDLAAVRARGVKVILTLGGESASFTLPDATAATNLVNDITAISNGWGGTASACSFDGIDWNNFEAGTAISTTQMTSVGQQLKAKYGPGFIVTSPVSSQFSRLTEESTAMAAMRSAGALDLVAPQFYGDVEGSNSDPNTVNSILNSYVAALGDAKYLAIGFHLQATTTADKTGCRTDEALAIWNTQINAHPTLRGAFNFSLMDDVNAPAGNTVRGKWDFAKRLGIVINPDGSAGGPPAYVPPAAGSNPKIATITETFGTAYVPGNWTTSGTTNVQQELIFAANSQGEISRNGHWELKDSEVLVRQLSRSDGSFSTLSDYGALSVRAFQAGYSIAIESTPTKLVAHMRSGAADPAPTVLTIPSTTGTIWLRIRETSGTTFWEYSNDRNAWTVIRSSVSPNWVTDCTVALSQATHN